MKILFVCTGNTCRSPMAAKIMQKKAIESKLNLEVQSAGIFALEGYPASEHAKSIMKEYGMADHHETTRISNEILKWADIVLTMTMEHKRILNEQWPEYTDKVYSLKEFIRSENGTNHHLDIEDPFGGSVEIYRSTAKEIEEAIDQMIKLNKLID